MPAVFGNTSSLKRWKWEWSMNYNLWLRRQLLVQAARENGFRVDEVPNKWRLYFWRKETDPRRYCSCDILTATGFSNPSVHFIAIESHPELPSNPGYHDPTNLDLQDLLQIARPIFAGIYFSPPVTQT